MTSRPMRDPRSNRGGWSRRGRLARQARQGPRAAIVLLVLALVLVPLGATAQSPSSEELAAEARAWQERGTLTEAQLRAREQELADTRAQLQDVRAERGQAETELARVQVRLDDARGRLSAAEGQVALAEVALEDAQVVQAEAEDDHRRAEAASERAAAELAYEEATLVDQIVHTFKYGTVGATRGAMVLEVLRRADDPNAFAVGLKQLQTVVADQDSVVQRVFELREEHRHLAEEAARARGVAVQAAFDAATTLEVVESLRAHAASVAAQIEQDEAHQQAVLDGLRADEAERERVVARVESEASTLRAELADQRRREVELRTRAEQQAQREAEERARAAEAAARRAEATRLALAGAAGGTPVADLVCPVVGAAAGRDFINDWGFPRSGGRTHQGNDIFAPKGTPVVAVHDGVVTRWSPPSSPTALGGITVTYRISDGSEWYNAHLDTIAQGIEPGVRVERGQLIGTVGNTGNARTTPPHLHLGRRQGGLWVNPFPTVAPACR